jgi:hypothetical protein
VHFSTQLIRELPASKFLVVSGRHREGTTA